MRPAETVVRAEATAAAAGCAQPAEEAATECAMTDEARVPAPGRAEPERAEAAATAPACIGAGPGAGQGLPARIAGPAATAAGGVGGAAGRWLPSCTTWHQDPS